MRALLCSFAAALFACSSICRAQDTAVDITFVPNSAIPQQQWPGDVGQMYEAVGKTTYCAEPTNAQAMTNFGVWGHDEGVSVDTGSYIFWFWGDTIAAYFDSTSHVWKTYQLGVCQGGGGSTGSCIGVDTVSFLPANSAFSGCRHLAVLDQALLAGSCPATTPYTQCSKMRYFIDVSHIGTTPKAAFNNESVSGLSTSPYEDLLGGHTPDGAFYTGGNIYITYGVLTQPRNPLVYHVHSGLLKVVNTATLPTSSGQCDRTMSTCPYFSKLYNFSVAPQIPTGNATATAGNATIDLGQPYADSTWNDPTQWQALEIQGTEYQVINVIDSQHVNVLPTPTVSYDGTSQNALFNMVPTQDNHPGKFMFNGTEILTNTQLINVGLLNFLPTALRTCPNSSILFAWGSGFYYRHSNIYLTAMCADATTIDGATNSGTGLSAAYYMAGLDADGNPAWAAAAEASAAPFLTSWHGGADSTQNRCVGELSVRWISQLKRFLLTYGSGNCGGLWYRTSYTPWGPWSAEGKFFPDFANGGWEQRLIYGPGADSPNNFNQMPSVYLIDPLSLRTVNLEPLIAPYYQLGNAYGPYQYPSSTAVDNNDGTVTVFLNVSGYNPYVTWQTSASFVKPPSARISGHVSIAPGVTISH